MPQPDGHAAICHFLNQQDEEAQRQLWQRQQNMYAQQFAEQHAPRYPAVEPLASFLSRETRTPQAQVQLLQLMISQQEAILMRASALGWTNCAQHAQDVLRGLAQQQVELQTQIVEEQMRAFAVTAWLQPPLPLGPLPQPPGPPHTHAWQPPPPQPQQPPQPGQPPGQPLDLTPEVRGVRSKPTSVQCPGCQLVCSWPSRLRWPNEFSVEQRKRSWIVGRLCIAWCRNCVEQHANARDDAGHAVAAREKDIDALCEEGLSLSQQGRLDDASECFRRGAADLATVQAPTLETLQQLPSSSRMTPQSDDVVSEISCITDRWLPPGFVDDL